MTVQVVYTKQIARSRPFPKQGSVDTYCQHNHRIEFDNPRWFGGQQKGPKKKGLNLLDFSGYVFRNIVFKAAFAESLCLRGAVFEDCFFDDGDFSSADFSDVEFKNVRFNKTIMTNSCFRGARFENCNLNRINISGSDFDVNEIRDTVVYGLSAWDVTIGATAQQSNLIIENTYDLPSELYQRGAASMSVDDIEVAQFVYMITNSHRLRSTLQAMNEKTVLLLGPFAQDNGLQRLHELRDALQKHGYIAMVFDFSRPDALNLTETVTVLAGLAKAVIADLRGPSVPHEIATICSSYSKPVAWYGNKYAMFDDVTSGVGTIEVTGNHADVLAKIPLVLQQIERFHERRKQELLGQGAAEVRI